MWLKEEGRNRKLFAARQMDAHPEEILLFYSTFTHKVYSHRVENRSEERGRDGRGVTRVISVRWSENVPIACLERAVSDLHGARLSSDTANRTVHVSHVLY